MKLGLLFRSIDIFLLAKVFSRFNLLYRDGCKTFLLQDLVGNNTRLILLQPDETSGTIKEQLAAIAPALEQLLMQKEERMKDFSDVQLQIQKICGEITGNLEQVGTPAVDETDLSLKKLDEYQVQLQELQKEKVNILKKSVLYMNIDLIL